MIQNGLENAFLAHYARRLSDLVILQGTQMLSQYGLCTPSSAVSTMMYLHKEKEVTITNLAQAFDHTHQMATQRINGLASLGLVEKFSNQNDQRSKLIGLTKKGTHEAEQLAQIIPKAAAAFDALFNEINCNLTKAIHQAEASLHKAPLGERITWKNNK
jgi:DNA-binding MarR family transcriptional regulator